MMAYTLVTRVQLFGKATCAVCSTPFVPKSATQTCCRKGCATILSMQRLKADPVRYAAWRATCKAGGRESARRRRRVALDALATRLGHPVTTRDLRMFRLGWELAIQTARERQQRRSGRVFTGAEEGVTAVG